MAGRRTDNGASIAAALAKFRESDVGQDVETSGVEFIELEPAAISPIDGEEVDAPPPRDEAHAAAPPPHADAPPPRDEAHAAAPQPNANAQAPARAQPEFRILEQLKRVHNAHAGHFGALTTYRRLLMLQDCCWGLSPSELRAEVG